MNLQIVDLRLVGRALGPLVVLLVLWTAVASAQPLDPMESSEDTRHFDFWPGTWVEVVDGEPVASGTEFTVRRSVHPAAFVERWRLFYDGEAHEAVGLRAWDQANDRWMFTWVSDDGHFQVWDGVEVGDDWYIVREFEIGGERFLSRQAWIPQGEDRLVRVMERSFDDGESWETRSRTPFVRVTGPAGEELDRTGEETVPERTGTDGDRAAIRALIDDLEAANVAGDVERWAGYFSDGAVYMPPGAPAVTTREGLVEVARAGFRHDADIDIDPVEIEICDDWAFARNRVTGTMTLQESREVVPVDMKQIVVYVRDGHGEWRIARMISNHNRQTELGAMREMFDSGRGEVTMAQVLGVGGIFFTSRDARGLGDWYRTWLGLDVSHPHGATLRPETMPDGGFTVWAPFDEETTYFDPSDRQFMFNLVVDDLDGALAQVERGGAEVVGDIEEYEYGRFGWFVDPEGNKVELWEVGRE